MKQTIDKIEKEAYWSGRSDEAARQYERIAELECHVEWLRETLKKTYFVYDYSGEAHTCIDGQDIDEAFRETPAQSLGEIKAAAIEEAVKKYENKSACDGNYIYSDGLLDYANQLRGEK